MNVKSEDCRALARFDRLPNTMLSTPTTAWPRANSRSARWLPMNPAAPVIRHFDRFIVPRLGKKPVSFLFVHSIRTLRSGARTPRPRVEEAAIRADEASALHSPFGGPFDGLTLS